MKYRRFGSVYSRKGRDGYYVQFHHGQPRKQYVRYGGADKKTARKRLAEVETLLDAGTPLAEVLAEVFGDLHGSRLTFRDATTLYLEYALTRKKPSTLKGDSYRLGLMREAPWAGEFLANVRADALTRWAEERRKPRTVERPRKRRKGETPGQYRDAPDRMEKRTVPGASGATINRDLNLGSALYRWAIRMGHVTENPFRGVERFSEAGRAREVYLTAEEARALAGAASAVLTPVIVAALATGMRQGETLALRWRSVDFARREVLVEPETEKAGRGRTIPMGAALYETLAALKAARPRPALDGSDPVFTPADGSPLGKWSLRKMFERAVSRCEGIPLDKRNRLRWHDLRHTAASLMVAAGVPIFDVAKTLGHSTLAVTMRYAHFAPEAGRAAVERLDAALALASPKAVPPSRERLGPQAVSA